MIRKQDREEFLADIEQGKPLIVAVFPTAARGMFGTSPAEVFDGTRGGVGHFYYIYLMTQWALAPFWLWLAPENMDPPIQEFLIGHLGYGTGDWLSGALLLMICADLALAISLRVLLFPVGPDGRADWRWNQRT